MEKKIRNEAIRYLSSIKKKKNSEVYTSRDIVSAYFSAYKHCTNGLTKFNSPYTPPTHNAEVLCIVLETECNLQVLRYNINSKKWQWYRNDKDKDSLIWSDFEGKVYGWRDIIVKP